MQGIFQFLLVAGLFKFFAQAVGMGVLGDILLPLILTSLNRIDTISNAMELRGFGKKSKRTWYSQRPFVRRDFIAITLGVALLLVSLTVTIRFGRFYNPFV